MLKAVIFDMDGVIVDSEPMHARAAILALSRFGVNLTMEYLDTFIGCTMNYMCKKMIDDFKINATVSELHQANDEMKQLLLEKEGHIEVPYVVDLIKNLYDNKVKLIIASSSSAEAIEGVMEALHILSYFEGYVSGNCIANPKPAPDIFLAAAKQLGIKPEECIVIEDSYHGVTAAKAANMTCIGYANPNSGKQDLRKADILVEGFEEIDYNFVRDIYQQTHASGVVLSTERTIIRELKSEDIPQLYQICTQPQIQAYIDDCKESLEVEIEKHEAYIQNIYRYYGYGLWGVYLKSDDSLIGRCGIELKMLEGEPIYELGYLLDQNYQGQGFAKEFVTEVIRYSFEHLHIPRVIVRIDKTNFASIKLASRIGMKQIGECNVNKRNCYLFELKKSDFNL